jgi:hypothetical protein
MMLLLLGRRVVKTLKVMGKIRMMKTRGRREDVRMKTRRGESVDGRWMRDFVLSVNDHSIF